MPSFSKKDLEKYTWGIGLEHEMHVFHIPKENQKENIEDIIVFDSESCVERLLENNGKGKFILSDSDYEFLRNIPFELSGRVCNKQVVLERIPIKMPELITWQPFCSLKKDRNMVNMVKGLDYARERFMKLLMKDQLAKKLTQKYGKLGQHPFGMSRNIKYSQTIKNNQYVFSKDKRTSKDKVHTDYNGSYHVTLTLPFTEKTSELQFLKMHQNFANQLQWLEPLILAGFFTGDEYGPGSIKERANGSYRVMIVGWGNIGGSDIRLFNKGLGRYAKTPTYWREKFKLYESDKLKPCLKPSPKAKGEGALTTLSTDFRTFGDDPITNERVSGAPMKKPNGIEFRIFDHFHGKHLQTLLLFLVLVAENSRKHQTKRYVYQNKTWIDTVQKIMKEGYSAQLSKTYIKDLEEQLHIKMKPKSYQASTIFEEVFQILFKKNIQGLYTQLLLGLHHAPSTSQLLKTNMSGFSSINYEAWNFALLLKLNRHPQDHKRFQELLTSMESFDYISFNELELCIGKHLGKSWKKDTVKFAHFFQELGLLHEKQNHSYMVKKENVVILKKLIKKNTNKLLNDYFYSLSSSNKEILFNNKQTMKKNTKKNK